MVASFGADDVGISALNLRCPTVGIQLPAATDAGKG
jgi:hypothetical protein